MVRWGLLAGRGRGSQERGRGELGLARGGMARVRVRWGCGLERKVKREERER